jgi:glutamyl-tRNA(Gln) amidotransferase subunit D
MKMSERENESYRGNALRIIKEAGAEIGDIVSVTKGDETLEGTLIPRSQYEADDYIVIKLRNGYNVGIRLSSEVKARRVGKGVKPSFTSPPPPKQNPDLPKVTILSTGGTIASRVDYRTGGVRPALTASDLYSVVPELSEIAQINAKIVLSMFSENITPKDWSDIATAIEKEIVHGADGVVVAHGTDTMGYTAAAISFALQNLPAPVVFVGSQRSADRPSSDAATNLVGAAFVAARAPFAEVGVAMHETSSDDSIVVHRGTRARKCHTSRRDAFRSVNSSPLARIKNNELTMLTQDFKRRNPKSRLIVKPHFEERVAILKFYPGMDSGLIDWLVDKSYRGLILEGSGLGHIRRRCFDSLQNAVGGGVIVGMTSQCI